MRWRDLNGGWLQLSGGGWLLAELRRKDGGLWRVSGLGRWTLEKTQIARNKQEAVDVVIAWGVKRGMVVPWPDCVARRATEIHPQPAPSGSLPPGVD